MKLVVTKEKDKVGDYYISDATRGFFGEKGEGKDVLEQMGLNPDTLPFSMAFYLKNRVVQWKDINGKPIKLSFQVSPHRIDVSASYLGKSKNIALYREWESYEDKDDIRHLESEAIGYQSMICLLERLRKIKT